MDLMGKGVAAFQRRIEEVFEVVDVHIAIAEAPAGRDVEVSHHLVDPNAALDATAFFSLLVQFLTVAFSFTLFNAVTPAKGPAIRRIRLPHLIARIAAAGFLRICGRWR